MTVRPRLGDLLLAQHLVTPAKLQDGLKAQMIYGGRLGTCLVELGLLDPDRLVAVLSAQLNVPVAALSQLEAVPAEVLELLPVTAAERFMAMPFRLEGRRLDVAVVDPNVETVDALRFATGLTVRPHIAAECHLVHMLERHYGIARPLRYIRLNEDDPMFPHLHKQAAAESAQQVQPRALEELDPSRTPSALLSTLHRFARAETMSAVFQAAVDFAEKYFEKLLVLASTPQGYRVALASVPEHVQQRIHSLSVSRDVFSTLDERKTHFGPLPPEAQNLLSVLDEEPASPVFAARVAGGTVYESLLLGLSAQPELPATALRELTTLAEKLSVTMDLFSLRKQLLTLPRELA